MKVGIRFKLNLLMVVIVIIILTVLSIGGVQRVDNNQTQGEKNFFIIISFLTLAFISCAAILTSLITKNILNPLKELNAATETIMMGKLDFEIKYMSNDEMGLFCDAFKLMAEKLKESLAKQAEYENSRKELIASISHDLRTPITSIRGYVEGLADGIVRDKEQEDRYLTIIKDKTEKLDALIEDLFQFSQIELGHFEMNLKERDTREFLEGIIKPLKIEFMDTPIKFMVEKPFPSVLIYADENRISQVFDNIINNARKYAGEKVEIKVKAFIEEGLLMFAIQDNRPGISEEDIPHIFHQFYRGDKSRSRQLGGTGLGLAICKQIIEYHGGKIWVESQMGFGTSFYFTLPIYATPKGQHSYS